MGGSVWVVKAQIHAGGRGKAGGVKLADGTKAKIAVDFYDDACNAEQGISVVRRIAGTDAHVVLLGETTGGIRAADSLTAYTFLRLG